MSRVLIHSFDPQRAKKISRVLNQWGFITREINSANANQLRNGVFIEKPDIVVLFGENYDPFFYKVIEEIVYNRTQPVVLIGKSMYDHLLYNLTEDPFFSKIDDMNDSIVPVIVAHLLKISNKIQNYENEIDVLKKNFQSEKVVSKTKFILLEKGFTENEAHKLIIDTSMKNRISKVSACKYIIDNLKMFSAT